jgi:Possible lysine decarboxylase
VDGYWQPLLTFLEHAVNERFLRAEQLETLLVERSPGALLDRMATYVHPDVDKWLDRKLADAAQTVPNTRSPASPNPGRM